MKKLSSIIIIILLSELNCKPKNDKYIQLQTQNIEKTINEIMLDFGEKNYKLYVLPKTTSDLDSISRKDQIETFNGYDYSPEGPSSEKRPLPPGNKDKNIDRNEYYKRESIVNYSDKKSSNIYLDYISVIILFDGIKNDKKEFLENLIKVYVLNRSRGDLIRIINKSEYLKESR